MSAIAITSLIFSIIFIIFVGFVFYYLWYKYPTRIKNAVYAGQTKRNRHTDKIEEVLDQEITNLVINESPELLELFPKSTTMAVEKNQVPGFVGMLMGKALPFLAKFMSSQEAVQENPALQLASSAAQSPAVIDTLLSVFKNFGPKPKKKRGRPPKEKTGYQKTEGNFPDW